MKYIALMDTSVMSFNIGDQIIMESIRHGLEPVLKDAFVINMPTHSPLFHWWEFSVFGNDSLTENLNKLDFKFVGGTNLLEKNMRKRKNTWNIHMTDSRYIKDFILVGVGTDSLEDAANDYTRKLYTRILNKDYTHSTRDESTKIFLEKLGFKAVNTGCPPLWGLGTEHCMRIPVEKSDKVIFTITDYMKDAEKDKIMIDVLGRNYGELYCWIQGSMDLEYLESLEADNEKIKLISPSLQAYNKFLDDIDCDYVGTRLHAGIKAMQKMKRTIIVGVDNRAYDMHLTYNFNYINRNSIENLENMINSSLDTVINIDERKINSFLNQFV